MLICIKAINCEKKYLLFLKRLLVSLKKKDSKEILFLLNLFLIYTTLTLLYATKSHFKNSLTT